MKVIRETARTGMDRVNALLDNDFPKAAQEASKLFARFPYDPDLNMTLGWMHYRSRNYQRALDHIQRAYSVAPEHPLAHHNMGGCRMALGELDLARRHFETARMKAGGTSALDTYLIALIDYRQGRLEPARRGFEDLADSRPDDIICRFRLSQVLADQENKDAALEMARTTLALGRADHLHLNAWVDQMNSFEHRSWQAFDDKARLAWSAKLYTDQEEDGFPWLPETYVLPFEQKEFIRAHEVRPRLWVVKPRALSMGYGIRVIDDPKHAPDTEGWVVQEYKQRPYLCAERKPTLRIFIVFIHDGTAVRTFLFNGGSTAFAMKPYRPTGDHAADLPMHVAHRAIFSGDERMIREAEEALGDKDTEWTLARLNEDIAARGRDPRELWANVVDLATGVDRLLRWCGAVSEVEAARYPNAYMPKLIALDLLPHEDLSLTLTEIESIPSTTRLFNGGSETNPVFDPWLVFALKSFTALDEEISGAEFLPIETTA